MSTNEEGTGRDFGYSLQMTNWILDSGVTCQITLEVSDFIPGSLLETEKYIEVADWHFVTAKQKGRVCINNCDDKGKFSWKRYIMSFSKLI